MIFDLVTPYKPNPEKVYFKFDTWKQDAWELFNLISDCYPNTQMRIVNFDGFENAIELPSLNYKGI